MYKEPFYKLVSESQKLPISVSEVGVALRLSKTQLKASSNFITIVIASVVEVAEDITRREMLTKEWLMLFDNFPGGGQFFTLRQGNQAIEMSRSVFQSIVEFKYLKSDDVTEVVIPATDYQINESADYNHILPLPDASWPTDVSRRVQSVSIQFKSGYGDDAVDVPKSLRMAMIQHSAHLFENRGACGGGGCSSEEALYLAPSSAMGIYMNHQILFMAF